MAVQNVLNDRPRNDGEAAMNIRCIVACRDASGVPTFFSATVVCSQVSRGAGVHYERAERKAISAGYTGPMITYDEIDGPSWLFSHGFAWGGSAKTDIPKKTVTVAECSKFRMAAGNEKRFRKVVWDNQLMEWVAIGWIKLRDAAAADRKKYPTVVEK